ncbi:MAG: low molecular weight protein arginine phosphatase [Verrucomicrobiaceae bacterium]|nr:low molecular weight protein arginine phosphatase [Verrucomicrobiaceae bacterium]
MSQKILFVCTGNVCRSPMAEGFLRHLAKEAGADIEVGSAGLGAMEDMDPSRHSVTSMKEEGIDISRQRSRMLTPEMIEEYTHIFGLGTGHVEAIRSYFPEAQEKTFVLREFVAEEGLDLEVPDPIGGDLDEYRVARNLIKEAMPSILRFVLTGDPAEPHP